MQGCFGGKVKGEEVTQDDQDVPQGGQRGGIWGKSSGKRVK
jgi:hypothetical protein